MVLRCIYTSTQLYECRGSASRVSLLFSKLQKSRLVYSEKSSTDFFIADAKSGMRALLKADNAAKVIPLVTDNILVKASSKSTELSCYLKRWLGVRHIVGEASMMRLEEGYIKGDFVATVGVLHRDGGVPKIGQPPESYSTGCLWRRLYLPVDVHGLIIG